MARKATSLGPKPSLFVLFIFLFFFLFSVVCSFLSLLLSEKKPCLSPRKGHFCLFWSVSLCFSLAFFGLPLFQFLFPCLSRVLFLFLSSCLSFLLSCGSLFLSLSFLFFLLCFCFMKGATSTYSIAQLFFINSFSFWVSCLVISF